MANPTADRNLLFGILALQMDFIDREALVTAMHAWVLQKAKPLGEILATQGKLSPERRSLLEALVQEHLKQHGQDAEKSLAAVSSLGHVREELRQIADPDVEASLVKVAAARGEEDPYATRAASLGTLTSSGLRFRILRPHAKGGLGQVSVARDEELHREVALKEIQPRHADDPESRSRFLLEAEITGGLEHPGIVPVYGLGCYGDGRPYYAMRFIRGDSLKEAIERFHLANVERRSPGERVLELRKLLGRFIDVCNAIEYAHSRGILHRDLKPGNIMLGKYGETLVVDWGLAKPMEQTEGSIDTGESALNPSTASSSATLMGSAIGTPAFMSPEQAVGRLDQLGPASDVYSLGATLYALLTGKTPFEDKDVGTVLQRVQRGEFPRPRQVLRGVPAALEAVCLKAMALKPTDRYPSPRLLADDLEHWLAEEPVAAYRDSLIERLARFARRHKSWTQAAAAALVGVAVVSVIAALLVDRARRVAAAALDDAKIAALAEDRARQVAVAALRDAEIHQARASQSFRLARQAVDDFFTKISETTLLDVPGLQPLRQDLLQVALRYDQAFLTLRADDRSVLSEVAAAWFRVGTITGEIHSKEEGLRALEQARDIQEQLLRDKPRDIDDQLALANTYNAIGGIEQSLSHLDEAERWFEKGRQLREQLVRAKPEVQEYQRKLASSYGNLGVVEHALGHAAEALGWYVRANDLRSTLVDQSPKVDVFRRDLARGHYNLGLLERESGKAEEGAKSFERAIEVYSGLVRDYPRTIEYRRELAVSHRGLGDLHRQALRTDDALNSYQQARELQEPLSYENPLVIELGADLAGTLKNLADLQLARGKTAEALKSLMQARDTLTQIVRENPAVPRFQGDLASTILQLGEFHRATGQPEAAREAFERAATSYQKLIAEHSQNTAFQDGLARSFTNLAQLQRQSGAVDEALRSCEQARTIYEQLARDKPKDATLQDSVAVSYANLAMVHQAASHFDEALEWYQKARMLHERFIENGPTAIIHRHHLAVTDYMTGDLELTRKRPAEALDYFQRARELTASLVADVAGNPEYIVLHAAATHDRGSALWDLDRLEETATAFQEAAAETQVVLDKSPQSGEHRQRLSEYYEDLATVQRDLERPADAVATTLLRKKLWPGNANELYAVARELALAAEVIGKGQDVLSAESQMGQDKYADLAIDALREALTAGYDHFDTLQSDPKLEIIRARPALKALLNDRK